MTRRQDRDEQALAAWAKEHLIYEVDTMVYALERLHEEPEGMSANVALESRMERSTSATSKSVARA
jgi:hypothetical protein